MRAHGVIIVAVCLSSVLAGAGIVRSQEKPRHAMAPQDDRPRPFPPDPTFNFVGSEMRFGGATVKGAPYSATITTESVQTLANGTRISHKTTASVYRDGEGRTRREQTFGSVGAFRASGDAPQMTFIEDPVGGVQYVLDTRNHTAEKMKLHSGPPPRNRPPSTAQVKTESLGTKTIEGVEAEGTRSTVMIPAGQIGNDQPVEIISERWYSPDLQVVVLSKHSDPRIGDHVYRLTNISRSEPAKTLFDVPGDFTITERTDRGPRPRMRPPDQN
jgi:hypothetical protein